jgi:mannose-6-phosphate isomerase-like protein (cupin superfamily)
MTMQPATASASGRHLPYEAKHIDDVEWETIRWPGETGKMLFHPRPERPTEPNAGILRLEPGAHHPIHNHDFAQVWYILSGEFRIDDNLYTPGTMIFHPDPHFEGKFETATGGDILIVQYPGPTTGGRPIYAGRFNMEKRRDISDERTDL